MLTRREYDALNVITEIGAAWDTHQNGYLTLAEFRQVMFKYQDFPSYVVLQEMAEFRLADTNSY